MHVRKFVVALMMVGGLVVVSGPVAGAAEHPMTGKRCAKAERKLPLLEGRLSRLQTQLTKSQAALAHAQQAGNQAVEDRMTARIQGLQLGIDKVNATTARIHQACG